MADFGKLCPVMNEEPGILGDTNSPRSDYERMYSSEARTLLQFNLPRTNQSGIGLEYQEDKTLQP